MGTFKFSPGSARPPEILTILSKPVLLDIVHSRYITLNYFIHGLIPSHRADQTTWYAPLRREIRSAQGKFIM